MLIAFDLDDTLVDTTGSIYPYLFQGAIAAMSKVGLPLADGARGLRDLLVLNRYRGSAQEALVEFIRLEGGSHTCLEEGLKVIWGGVEHLPEQVQPMEGACHLLQTLKPFHRLALVTRGEEELQLQKLIRAGIDPDIFAGRYFCPGGSKQPVYAQLKDDAAFQLGGGVVCGDRIRYDLTPAKQEGWKTVHLRAGRGLGETGAEEDVDHAIVRLKELNQVLEEVKNRWGC